MDPSAPPPHARVRPGSWPAWRAALRPRSLWLAASPVLVGAALAARAASIDPLVLLLALAAALTMQVVTNLQNDVGYTLRGGESVPRTGLPRATAQGWLSAAQVRRAIIGVSATGLVIGIALAALRGWPVFAIGATSLAAALAYMGGPRPIAYGPLGELTVFVFFGLVAVAGTEWVITGGVGAASLPAGAAIGSLAAAALAINNHRDRRHDAATGRRTFAVRCGDAASRRLFDVLLALPFGLVLALWAGDAGAWPLPWLLAPSAWRLRRDFRETGDGAGLNAALARAFALTPKFALLLATGIVLGSR